MEIIIGLVILAAAVYYFTRKRDVAEANAEAPVALGEPPATVVVPVAESATTIVVEGAGAVEVPAKKARAKKPAAIKAAKPKAPKAAAKPKAPAKPRAKKPATK